MEKKCPTDPSQGYDPSVAEEDMPWVVDADTGRLRHPLALPL